MNHDPLADVSDLHPVTPAVREVLDLLGLDPGHHPSVRLSRADWGRVEAVRARIAQPEKECCVRNLPAAACDYPACQEA